MGALLPLLALPLFFLIGLGVYRPYKYGTGARRHLGLLPLGLVVLGYAVVPFVMGLARGFEASRGSGVATGPSSAEIVAIVLPVLLAVAAGAYNARMFRPRQA